MLSFRQFLENTEVKNAAPVDEIKRYAQKNGELHNEDDDWIVVEPKNHKSACFYGSFTRSRFCVANPDDSSEFEKIASIKMYTGEDATFLYAFSKNLSLKNKNAVFGMMIYPPAASNAMRRGTPEQLVAQGKARFQQMFGKEFAYSDDFLIDWVNEVLKEPRFFESYNSNNKIVKPSELKQHLGSLYAELVS